MATAAVTKGSETMAHYYAIAERGDGGTWWISFPGRDGIVSAAEDAGAIVAQAQDALASAAMYGGQLPPAIEDGAKPPADLIGFDQPTMVVVIPFAAPVTRVAAE
jgi:predicted RNase H-like HicB family nuclease